MALAGWSRGAGSQHLQIADRTLGGGGDQVLVTSCPWEKVRGFVGDVTHQAYRRGGGVTVEGTMMLGASVAEAVVDVADEALMNTQEQPPFPSIFAHCTSQVRKRDSEKQKTRQAHEKALSLSSNLVVLQREEECWRCVGAAVGAEMPGRPGPHNCIDQRGFYRRLQWTRLDMPAAKPKQWTHAR